MLLAPGKSHTYKVSCSGLDKPDASVVQWYTTVRLEPYREFLPDGRLATPYYQDAPMTASELRLR